MQVNLSLKDLFIQYVPSYYQIEETETIITGNYGISWKFDIILKNKNDRIGVYIKDWNRSIGINHIQRLYKALVNTDCIGGIFVGNQFSLYARSLAEKLNIRVLDRNDLV